MRSDWRVYAKRADFKGIAGKYGIDQVIARIIRNRDICGDAAIDMYLNGDINDMHNPESMKDAVLSVDIITQKIKDKCKIRIIGDYDIDGICSYIKGLWLRAQMWTMLFHTELMMVMVLMNILSIMQSMKELTL